VRCFSEGAAACPGARFEVFAATRRDSMPVRLIGRQVRVLLQIVLQVRVDDGTMRVAEGRADTPDLVIEAGPGVQPTW